MSDNGDIETEGSSRQELRELMNSPERIAAQVLIGESLDPETGPGRKTFDELFETLSDPGRRYVLTYLLRSDGYVRTTELVDYVMSKTRTSKSNEKFRRRVTAELTHTHLPALVDDGYIRYNMERQLIDKTEKLELVAPYLKLALVQKERLEKE